MPDFKNVDGKRRCDPFGEPLVSGEDGAVTTMPTLSVIC